MKSKFSINIVAPILLVAFTLYMGFGTLIQIIVTSPTAYWQIAAAGIASLIILIILYRFGRYRFNRIRIERDALHIGPFFGLWTNRIPWNQVSLERDIEWGEESNTKLLYIYINNIKKVKISAYYYANMYNLYRSLLRKAKASGTEYSVLRRQAQ